MRVRDSGEVGERARTLECVPPREQTPGERFTTTTREVCGLRSEREEDAWSAFHHYESNAWRAFHHHARWECGKCVWTRSRETGRLRACHHYGSDAWLCVSPPRPVGSTGSAWTSIERRDVWSASTTTRALLSARPMAAERGVRSVHASLPGLDW